MNTELFVGFAAIAGILAGYITARIGTRWMLFALWGASTLLCLLMLTLTYSEDMDEALVGIYILFGLMVPFTACAFFAGGLGLLVRRLRRETEPE